MSRMSELSQVLDDMISCGEEMIKAAREIKEIFSEPATAPEPAAKPAQETAAEHTAVAAPERIEPEKTQTNPEIDKQQNPETAQEPNPETYSFEEVRKACAAKSHAGFTNEVRELIHKYGSDRLSGIKQESYPALMHDLEVIG